jgi:glycine/D-amino acid oxidase-like deaminating enzyme
MDTDVLIVGAGPTGLMLANQLVRHGVRVLIIDRHAGPSVETRALGVQARTLQIYTHLGIVERALELGKIGTGANLWAQGRKMGHVPLGEAGKQVTPYPYILILGNFGKERKGWIGAWEADPKKLDIEKFLSLVEAIGKGRFAQRLASRMGSLQPPPYIRGAIDFVTTRV